MKIKQSQLINRSQVLMLLGIPLLLLSGFSATVGGQDRKPNIVILLADDLGWGDVGYHGSKISTPNIDKLSQIGTRLNQFYVQPVCSPTRGALMTGRYPIRLGLQCGVVRPWAQHGLPLDERTLPSALREVGYKTAVVGKWHLGHNKPGYLPLKRGFDQQYGHYNGALDYFTHIRDGGHDWHKNDQRNDDQGYATDLIGREAVRVIRDHDKSKPLFLYVPFNAPHTPLQATKEYLARYADWPNKQRATYAAMVTGMDKAIGEIIDALKKNDFSPSNTIVFFCSDNGGIPRFGSNLDLRAGKGTLYEGGVRVPAIMVWEGRLKAKSQVNSPLHIVDLYPTLLKLAGAEMEQPKPLDGKDAWPAIAEGKGSPHDVILHNVTPFGGSLRMGDWKIVHNGRVTANATAKPKQETWELFNLADDPSEQSNLRKNHPKIFKQLRSKLEAFRDAAVAPNIPPNKAPANFHVPKVWGESN